MRPRRRFTEKRLIFLKEKKSVFFWIYRGKSSMDMGAILSISENTVNFHIKNAKNKLNCSSRTVAAVKALKLGIVDI
ncbi:LuxR C-terminal-related transcriptional regulator [Mesorhizobium kowhaii]|uniref:LuxR C-terminal-related transcriptional regulator n=1 Tax=Mesorhizobium kowhaii TaxID=1300272 RepID=UPI00315C542B